MQQRSKKKKLVLLKYHSLLKCTSWVRIRERDAASHEGRSWKSITHKVSASSWRQRKCYGGVWSVHQCNVSSQEPLDSLTREVPVVRESWRDHWTWPNMEQQKSMSDKNINLNTENVTSRVCETAEHLLCSVWANIGYLIVYFLCTKHFKNAT